MLYVTGDTHGDYERFTSYALKKLKKGDTLFICGDFGFIWDGSKNEEKLLKKIGKLKYNVCFIDGTHENFERLRSYEVSEFKGGKVHHITGNLYHLMRGQTYDFDGVSVFAMGGGESPDIDIRSDLNSWSGDEIPTSDGHGHIPSRAGGRAGEVLRGLYEGLYAGTADHLSHSGKYGHSAGAGQ